MNKFELAAVRAWVAVAVRGLRAAPARALVLLRSVDGRNYRAMAAMAIMVAVSIAGVLESRYSLLSSLFSPPDGDPVQVSDIRLDRQDLRTVDIFFDRVLMPEPERIGRDLPVAPATVSPETAGRWYWTEPSVLRFEPTEALALATRYDFRLVPDRFLPPGTYLQGAVRLSASTDRFRVVALDLDEETLAGPVGQIALRGEIRFNYPVSPVNLDEHMRLVDPVKGERSPVGLTFLSGGPGRVIAFRTEPLIKAMNARGVRFEVAPELQPVVGNVTLMRRWYHTTSIGSIDNLVLREVDPVSGGEESRIHLRFSSPVDPNTAREYIEVQPAEDYRLTSTGNTLTLAGGFKPGTESRLVVSEGLVALDGAPLRESQTLRVRFDDLPPYIDFKEDGEFLAASGDRTVVIESRNIPKAQLRIDRVHRNNLHAMFVTGSFGSAWRNVEWYGDRIVDEELDLGGPANETVSTAIDLDRFIQGKGPGVYRVTLAQSTRAGDPSRWLMITDLGVVAKRSGDEFMVWVSSFSDLRPVRSARVRLLSHERQVLASGLTDDNGIWRAGNLNQLPGDDRAYLLDVAKGRDYSFLAFHRHAINTAGLDVEGIRLPEDGYRAFFYGERDLYRPGEALRGLAVVRDGRNRVPPSMPVLVRHIDPTGRRRDLEALQLDGDGGAELTLPIPSFARTGDHKLELVIAEETVGSHAFQVEEFVPDRIKVSISTAEEDYRLGDEMVVETSGTYLFGAPAAGLDAESRVRLHAAVFSSSRYPDHVFRNGSRDFDEGEVFRERDVTNEEGKRAFAVTLPHRASVPSSLEAVISSRIREDGGRGVTATQRVRIHPYPYYLGLKRVGEGYATPDSEVELQYVAVTPGDAPAAAGALKAEFFRDRWNTVWRETSSGGYRWESYREPHLIDTRTLPAGTESGGFGFVPPASGSYRVVLTDASTGASTELAFTASGWGYSPWAIRNPSRLDLELDREEYASGASAEVQIRSPFPGRVWLTVERDTVRYSRIFDLAGNTASVKLPVRPEWQPNVYVTATLIRSTADLPSGQPARAFGSIPLTVDVDRNRLDVRLEVAEEIRPESQLAVDVRTAPHAVVTVAAVDEGILQLVDQATPDPFPFFYRQIALGVRSYDTFAWLMPESKPSEGDTLAGGGFSRGPLAESPSTAGIRRAKPVSFWSGALKADSSGRANVSFAIPEFQGTLRLMAVAHAGDRFGSTERFTQVRSPLVVLPTVPRFISFAERFRIPVAVRNATGRAGSFQVTLRTEGPITDVGEGPRSIDLADGAQATVHFDLESGDRPGEIGVQVRAVGNGEVSVASATLPLRPDLPERTVTAAGLLAKGATTLREPDLSAFRTGSVVRTLRVSGLPLIRFQGKLRQLLRYPHGCLEQTTSRAFPLLFLGDLAGELGAEFFGGTDPAALVQRGVERIAIMQLANGGFALWPGGDDVHRWGTVYATHFLVEARRAGHFVNRAVYDDALAYLQRSVTARGAGSETGLPRTVYALYVLARAGAAELGAMEVVRSQWPSDRLSPWLRALFGAAYAAAGNRGVLEELARDVVDVEPAERETGGDLNSTVRNRAVLLLAFLDAYPQHPAVPQLVERLMGAAESDWWSTQESGFAFLALGQFFRNQQVRAAYAGRVSVAGEPAGMFGAETATFAGLPASGYLRIEVDDASEGPGYYAASVRGIPADDAYEPEQRGMAVRRKFMDREGKSLDLDAVRQGQLVIMETQVRSLAGRIDNVVVESLLPAGLEVENPRLEGTERLSWMKSSGMRPEHLDLRDDRVLAYTRVDEEWKSQYSLLRAVTVGTFRVPPVSVEAMYDRELRATGGRATLRVEPVR